MPRTHNLPLNLLLLYAAFIIYATIIPFAFDTPPENFAAKLHALAADPLRLKSGSGFSLTDAASNVLLFVPFGVLFLLAWQQASLPTRRKYAVLGAVSAAFVLSGLVEFMQFFSERRVTSLLDCVANGAGTLVGAFAAARFKLRLQTYLRLQFWLQTDESKLFTIYTVMLALAQLMPLRPTLDFSTIKATLKSIDWALPQTPAALGSLWAETILYAGFAFLWLRTQREATQTTQRIIYTIGLTSGATLLLEALQIFLVGHVVRLRNLLAGFEGGMYGAVCFMILKMQAARQPRAQQNLFDRKNALHFALAHLIVYMLLLELQPYQFNFALNHLYAQAARFHWLPFIEYYQNTDAHAVLDFTAGAARFALLAVLLRTRARLMQVTLSPQSIFAVVLGMSLVLELLQLSLPQHAPGLTDCVSALLGAAVGIGVEQKYFRVTSSHFKVSSRRAAHAAHAAQPPRTSTSSRPIMRQR